MRRTLTQGTIYLTISSFIFMISGYLTNIWLGRSLGPVDYGLYGVIISLAQIVNTAQTSGLTQAVSKYAASTKRPDAILRTGLNLQILFTFIVTLLFFLLAKPVAYLLNDPNLIPYLQLSSLIFPFYAIYALYIDYYNGLHSFGTQALMNIGYSVLKVISVIGLAFFFHLYGVIYGFIIAPIIALVIGFRLPKNVRGNFSYKLLIIFALPLIGFAILSYLQQTIDLFFVKALLFSSKDPGYYTASLNIARIIFFALSAFALVLFPSISRGVAQKNIDKIRFLIHKSLRMILILLVPGTILISVTSASIVHLLYSTAYLPAAPSLSVLIFGIGFLTVFIVLASILNGAGEPKKSLWISALGVIVTAILCWILVPKYGLVGAALSTTIGSFISMVIVTYFVYQRFHALVPVKSVIKIIFASSIIYFLAKLITFPLLLLPVLYIFLFAVYVGILIILKEITFEDWKQVKSLIPSWVPFVNNV